jgi:hypothetical protein
MVNLKGLLRLFVHDTTVSVREKVSHRNVRLGDASSTRRQRSSVQMVGDQQPANAPTIGDVHIYTTMRLMHIEGTVKTPTITSKAKHLNDRNILRFKMLTEKES